EQQTRAIAGPVTLNQITLMPFRNTGPLPQIQVPGHSGKAIESGADAQRTAAQQTAESGAAQKTGPAPKAAPSAPAQAAASTEAPAPAPAPVPEPEPELAVVSAAAAAASPNGRSSY